MVRIALAISVSWLSLLFVSLSSRAQDASPEADRAALEKAFADTLTGSELRGTFNMRDDSKPGSLHEESYAIQKAIKLVGDKWLITARIKFGEVDMPFPVPVDVLWAGDTPVITLTDAGIPGLGKFTVRVLIYRGEYAGTWDGGGEHRGHLFGKVVTRVEIEKEKAASGPSDGAKAVDKKKSSDGGFERMPHGPFAADPGPMPLVALDQEASDETKVAQNTNWPSFRGRYASGIAEGYPLAEKFDVETGENITYRTPIDGLSHSAPIVWDDCVFLVTAVRKDNEDAELKVGLYGSIEPVEDEGEHDFRLLCLERNSGEVVWEETCASAVPAVKRHPKGSHAASAPATDGEHVVAFFASEGLFCYNVDGTFLWDADFGVLDSGYYAVPDAQWGFASSPVIHDDLVILQVDVQKDSFLAALDVETGKEVWRVSRDDVPTWGTPTVDVREGRKQIIVNGWKHIGGYDLQTGAELWRLEGGGDIPVPTPIVSHDLIFITNAHGRFAPIFAIDVMAEGTLDMQPNKHEDMIWSQLNRGNYMQTPLVYNDELFLCSDAGVLACHDARTGKEHYRERLDTGGSGFTASGVAGAGKLYFTSEIGMVSVVKAGTTFEVIATANLGEECMATPAISAGHILFRTHHHLISAKIGGSEG